MGICTKFCNSILHVFMENSLDFVILFFGVFIIREGLHGENRCNFERGIYEFVVMKQGWGYLVLMTIVLGMLFFFFFFMVSTSIWVSFILFSTTSHFLSVLFSNDLVH